MAAKLPSLPTREEMMAGLKDFQRNMLKPVTKVGFLQVTQHHAGIPIMIIVTPGDCVLSLSPLAWSEVLHGALFGYSKP